MRTIFKYPLPDNMTDPGVAGLGEFYIDMPKGARPLWVALQEGVPFMWCEVDTDKPTEDRQFILSGTGQAMPDGGLHHIGSYQRGWFVGHVFMPVTVL